MIIEEDSHAAAEEGENYFVSMTDMMVGVLFIFIIMLMVFALDFRTKTDTQKIALEAAQQAAAKVNELQKEIRSHIAAMDEAAAARRTLLERIRDQLAKRNIEVVISPKSDVLRITENAVLFGTSSWTLDGQAEQNVETIAVVLRNILADYVACRSDGHLRVCREETGPVIETVFIEGHTDSRGDDRNNWQLSTARAAETFQQMVRSAPELRTFSNRDDQEILSVSGYSSARPVDKADTAEAWGANRRIDLRFVMENDNRERLEQLRKQTDDMEGEIQTLIKAIGGAP
jgi:flagellar motor protein MotB